MRRLRDGRLVGSTRYMNVEPVQRQIAQQVVKLTLMAKQAQIGLAQNGLQQPVHHELGQAIRDAHRQTDRGRANCGAHLVRQSLAQLKNLVGLLHGGVAGIGQHQAAAGWLEQGKPQRALQFPHLGAHGLHGHAQFVGSPGDAALLGHHPKIVEVLVVE